MTTKESCPACGSTNVSHPEADVGVGVILGPLQCGDCGYVDPVATTEMMETDPSDEAEFEAEDDAIREMGLDDRRIGDK